MRDQAGYALVYQVEPERVRELVPIIVQLLESEDFMGCWDTLEVLRGIGPAAMEAVPALIQTLEDTSPFIREEAAKALREITGQDFGEDAAAWQEWWEQQQ